MAVEQHKHKTQDIHPARQLGLMAARMAWYVSWLASKPAAQPHPVHPSKSVCRQGSLAWSRGSRNKGGGVRVSETTGAGTSSIRVSKIR
jgi:hypothetical protein